MTDDKAIALRLVKKAPVVKEQIQRSECFVLRAAALYRSNYAGKPPAPGYFARLSAGELRGCREAVHAALRRGAIRLVDAREELAVLQGALEVLGQVGPGTVPTLIGEEPFQIRETRKPNAKRKKKRKKKR